MNAAIRINYKIMKIEDLKGTKIYISNEEDRVKFQEKVFSLGVEWRDGAPHEIVSVCPFYYISYNYKLTRDCATSSNFFISHPYKQAFLDDVLEIEEPKKECDFKHYDKVLVRNDDDERWKVRLFSWFDPNEKEEFRYETTDGGFYKICIPYDDELANTKINKKL